ncbi:MAG: hypothetical protein WA194_08890 [Patescibacteria group bacterium]
MSEQSLILASEKTAAIETVVNGFRTYGGISDQDRQGRLVWLSVLQDGARDWKFEDWFELERAVKANLHGHPSYSMIMGIVGSKMIITTLAETVEKSEA